jgi:DNA repair protein RadA
VKNLLTIRKLGLMIVDTLTENFLETYGRDEELIQRQLLLGRHLHDLALLAIHSDMAVVVTNNVRSVMGEAPRIVEIGGNTLAQSVHRRVHLAFAGGRRVARLISPLFDHREVYYRIDEIGVTDKK